MEPVAIENSIFSMTALGRKPTVDLHHNLAPSLSDWTVAYRPIAACQAMCKIFKNKSVLWLPKTLSGMILCLSLSRASIKKQGSVGLIGFLFRDYEVVIDILKKTSLRKRKRTPFPARVLSIT